jgi:hypothetical protein
MSTFKKALFLGKKRSFKVKGAQIYNYRIMSTFKKISSVSKEGGFKVKNGRLSQRAGWLMNTEILRELNRDIPRMTEFQAAIEAAESFEALDHKWQALILKAEEEQRKGDHK